MPVWFVLKCMPIDAYGIDVLIKPLTDHVLVLNQFLILSLILLPHLNLPTFQRFVPILPMVDAQS